MRDASESATDILRAPRQAGVEGWAQPLVPGANNTQKPERPNSPDLASEASCDLRHPDVNENVLRSFEDLLRAGGPPMQRPSLEGSRRSYSEYPLRQMANFPERDARSAVYYHPSSSSVQSTDAMPSVSSSPEHMPPPGLATSQMGLPAQGLHLQQTPPSADWTDAELQEAESTNRTLRQGRRLLMEPSEGMGEGFQRQMHEQQLPQQQQQQQIQMSQGALLSHQPQSHPFPHHDAGQRTQQQQMQQQQQQQQADAHPQDPSLHQYKQMYPHPQQLAALLLRQQQQQQQQRPDAYPHAAPACSPGYGPSSSRLPERSVHEAANPPLDPPTQYAQPGHPQRDFPPGLQFPAEASTSQHPGPVPYQPGQPSQRQHFSSNPLPNPLSPRTDPLQKTHSNLSTFSSLGPEATMDTARYSASLMSSMGSSGYSSGYASRQQAGGAPMSGLMSTAQSLLSTSQSMSGMQWSGGGLMSTGQSSGAWDDNEGRELARELAGLSQAQGMRPPVPSARSHASLGMAGRKYYTTQQHPFARTHSVDSALPNPDLLDTPPRGGLFATSSSIMPSLLETSDSQGFQALWQVWIGNVLPDVSRHDILAILDRFGPVQDVITFPGHSYAIANFLDEGSAVQAVASLHEQQVPLLSGQSRLMLSLKDERSASKVDSYDRHHEFGLRMGSGGERHPPSRQGEWEGATVPSSRIWLGNIAATATQRCVRQIFGKFGHLTDAAVFPARIGPLGYAFVNFEQVGHAMRAYDMLNNAVVPLLTGNKQLKMRFKPAKENEPGPSGLPSLPHAMSSGLDLPAHELLPSSTGMSTRSLILGNVSLKPNRAAIEVAFGSYGLLEAVRTFPGKPYAIVHFHQAQHAAQAAASLDGIPVASISGHRPLVVRLQSALQAAAIQGMQGEAGPSSFQAGQGGRSIPRAFTPPMTPSWETSLSAGSSPTMGAWPGMAGPSHLSSLQTAGLELAEMPLPAVNLSNRLNPNNVHFDTTLAARYKRMGKAEKEALWAADRLQQQQANLANLDAHGLQAETAGGSLESQLGRLRQELLLAQQQGGLMEQQPQGQQLPTSQQLLDQQAAQILNSLGSTDLASLLNRRDLTMPAHGGPDITAVGTQQAFIEQQQQKVVQQQQQQKVVQQQQQQQMVMPEQWQYRHPEQQQEASGRTQPTFPQETLLPDPREGMSQQQQQQQQQPPLTVLQMSRQGSRGDTPSARNPNFNNLPAGGAMPSGFPQPDMSRLPPQQVYDRMPLSKNASDLRGASAGWRQPEAQTAPTGQPVAPPSSQALQHQQQLANLRRDLAANPY